MRKDMPKVLTESPRYHSQYRNVKGFKTADAPKFDGDDYKSLPLKYRAFRTKEFTDHISPLFRFLIGCIGRMWNDVWSEICQTIPNGGVSLSHARDHIFDFVDIHNNGIGWSDTRPLYVDESGILTRRQPKIRQKNNRNNHGKGIVIDGRRFHFRNGWFELTMLRYVPHKYTVWRYDCWLHLTIWGSDTHQLWLEYGQYVYCAKKRQLGKAEIRKLGLPRRAT